MLPRYDLYRTRRPGRKKDAERQGQKMRIISSSSFGLSVICTIGPCTHHDNSPTKDDRFAVADVARDGKELYRVDTVVFSI